MIAYIRGIIDEITEQAVLIETNGIGYEVICPNPLQFQAMLGQKEKIYTYHHVREDAQTLYGFQEPEEKQLFAKILNVSGIGPKGALAVLASTSVMDFVMAIEQENEKFLTSFPGVGKKTARQMILDLKGKLPFEYHVEKQESTTTQKDMDPALNEAIEALKALGYSDKEINQIKPRLKEEKQTEPDGYIRKGLALMMKQ
ncbi:Holliday junction branch migration protein RuvA [Gracilibacillus dipsosauri]|uniref:Holliday junction branch migration complex subunit RuvA n=1 Tax=Gracilibacillus dipsosauri TaxID=178340 RepID=A0A317KXV5_9BACI|nr:Holliday junction branch migration protein RuvA [Gracilibacillus dipsosauri]PWU68362.1 Holliday junction branch migration protein RuvA [Gracilibacillus dipsosauri]